MKRNRPDICLNMIVKNETAVLGRAFDSVCRYISYYVIVDTGSTDGTQAFIREWMDQAGIEGEVHEREWVNFGHNRQQALELTIGADRSAHVLFIDADEELVVENPECFRNLKPGVSYRIPKRHDGCVYSLPQLIDIRQTRWRWKYPVHNALIHEGGSSEMADLPGVWIQYHSGEGAKSHGVTTEEKYLRDARLLEDYLVDDPDSSRCQFYLAQSYRDAGHTRKAFEAYRKRVKMDGWDEETYVAHLEMGRAAEKLNLPEHVVLACYLAAFESRPTRAESLHALAKYLRLAGKNGLARLFSSVGAKMSQPPDQLFVEPAVYAWKLLDEWSIAAYWTGNYQESRDACEEVLRRAEAGVEVPVADLERVSKNLQFALTKLRGTD